MRRIAGRPRVPVVWAVIVRPVVVPLPVASTTRITAVRRVGTASVRPWRPIAVAVGRSVSITTTRITGSGPITRVEAGRAVVFGCRATAVRSVPTRPMPPAIRPFASWAVPVAVTGAVPVPSTVDVARAVTVGIARTVAGAGTITRSMTVSGRTVSGLSLPGGRITLAWAGAVPARVRAESVAWSVCWAGPIVLAGPVVGSRPVPVHARAAAVPSVAAIRTVRLGGDRPAVGPVPGPGLVSSRWTVTRGRAVARSALITWTWSRAGTVARPRSWA